jgi:GTP diphosphokinase / guanosine-3',5'-bis(diphosphate) 3'-diphosphatase
MSDLDFENFFSKLENNEKRDKRAIKTAFELGKKYHANQLRKITQQPYFTHPIGVALLLKKFDDETIISALLHDTLEDTDLPEEMIRQYFSDQVYQLVKGMTKTAEKSIFDALEEVASLDNRVIYIKLADRYHNMSDNIEKMPEKTRTKYSIENLRLIKIAKNYNIDFLTQELIELQKKIDETGI